MPMDINDPQMLEQVRQAAAARGLSVDAYLRMIQNLSVPAGNDAPVMPKQRPFAEGPGPGGGYGGGQGQNDQPWKQYFPGGSWSESFGTPGIGNQVSPAGGPTDPNAPVNINAGGPLDPNPAGGGYESQPDPEADTSIFGQIRNALSYGGISFADRLGNAGTVLSAFADPQGRSLTPAIAKANENMSELRDMAERKQLYYADQKKKQQMAQSIYNNLKDSNPQMAEAILYDPSLVDDYMKGQLDLENTRLKEDLQQNREIAVEGVKQKGAMELEEFKTENDPARMRLDQETKMFEEFLDANELRDSSTLDIYKTYFDDENMNANEAKRLASAHISGGQVGLDEMYTKIVEKREAAKPIAQQALEMSGVELQKGQQITNAQEVVESGGKVAPKLGWAEGTAEAEAKKAEVAFDIKTNSADYLATQRAIDHLDIQESGEAWTGAGWGGLGEMLPESNAKELGRALQSVNAGEAFKKLMDIRRSNTTGAGVGNVTEGEYPIMTAAEGEKFDILQDPKILRQRLVQHQNVGIAFMAMAPDKSPRSMLQYLVDGLRANPTPENIEQFDKKFGAGYSRLVLSTEGEVH